MNCGHYKEVTDVVLEIGQMYGRVCLLSNGRAAILMVSIPAKKKNHYNSAETQIRPNKMKINVRGLTE